MGSFSGGSYGDGAYNIGSSRAEFHGYDIDPVVPPRRGAILHGLEKEPWMKALNDATRAIAGLGNDDEARKNWKMLAGYHKMSLGGLTIQAAETNSNILNEIQPD